MNNSIITNFITNFVDSPLSYIATYILFVLCIVVVIKVVFFRENKNKELNIIVNIDKKEDNNIFAEYELRNKIKKLRKVSNELAQSKTLIKSCLPTIIAITEYKEEKGITLIPTSQSNINHNKSIIIHPEHLSERLREMKKITIYAKNTIPSIQSKNPI